MRESFQKLEEQNFTIIFVDETMFTFNTLFTRDYSNKGQNITIQEKALSGKTLAVVAGISLQDGLIHYEIFENSVNKDKFLLFLQNIRMRTQEKNIAIFLDNLRVHHNKEIKKYCEDENIIMIFNLPYTPQLNPIEEFFSLVKNSYKRIKINSIINEGMYNPQQIINKSMKNQQEEAIKNICCSGHKKLNMSIEQIINYLNDSKIAEEYKKE